MSSSRLMVRAYLSLTGTVAYMQPSNRIPVNQFVAEQLTLQQRKHATGRPSLTGHPKRVRIYTGMSSSPHRIVASSALSIAGVTAM